MTSQDNRQIDENKTRAIFEHPGGNTIVVTPTGQVVLRGFSELGTSVGVFEYRGQYYIETFYGSLSGDFHGGRKNQPSVAKTLAVMFRQKDMTSLVCEYQMSVKFERPYKN